MTETPPDSMIPYDEIVQEALRAVVGRVLGQVQANGSVLPGGHHFYITFKSQAPGVDIPDHLLARFPDEMTIVLQNKFWDLVVADDFFSVGLSFNQMPAKLVIPYAAITAFVDPAVDFGLQFQPVGHDAEPEPHEDANNDAIRGPGADAEQGGNPGVDDTTDGDDGSNVVTVDFGKKK
ncbi:ClpXP protease specificity-enhancing factor SspB [uncultured Croceicoccus sp.]|uniref:SspB family protein n=1 Tax=uncultured Croceicoccus sp. TaxID=1295329 RepID=UPI002636CA76|nr:ClpXP protease specificity-enhancing factor SspB [uncultured Croceicoccus sp.]